MNQPTKEKAFLVLIIIIIIIAVVVMLVVLSHPLTDCEQRRQ